MQPFLKSENGIRDIDLPTSIAEVLKAFVGDRTSGACCFLSHVIRNRLTACAPIFDWFSFLRSGCRESFKRFDCNSGRPFFEQNSKPEDLLRFWLGHANKSVTLCGAPRKTGPYLPQMKQCRERSTTKRTRKGV
jgi:hypothetical protein